VIALRPYQQACVKAVAEGWQQFRKQLIVIPTGGGKTILFSHIAHEQLNGPEPRKTLILAHRDELIDQAILKLHKATGIFAQKEKAECRASPHAEVVVASIQTMARRLDRWPSHHFGLVVIDEAHHVAADSYKTVLRHFEAHSHVLGVTATPDRSDRKDLGAYFENVPFEIPLFELIRDGFLARIKVKALPLKIDLQNVKKTSGDYNAEDLDTALHPYLEAVAQQLAEHAPFRKTLVFLPLVATSKDFVQACKNIGLAAVHIDGTSPDRRDILARFSTGDFDILSNAMLLTEGYDEPAIDCIVNLRPTRSRSLYSQIIGRGTRTAPGKEDLLVLDFLWQHEDLALIRPAHLVAASKEEAEEITNLTADAAFTQEELDLEELQRQTSRRREEKLKRELAAKARRQARTVDPVEFCLSLHNLPLAEYEPTMRWEKQPATDAQKKLLRSLGIDTDGITKGYAVRLLDVLFRAAEVETRHAKAGQAPEKLRPPLTGDVHFRRGRPLSRRTLPSKARPTGGSYHHMNYGTKTIFYRVRGVWVFRILSAWDYSILAEGQAPRKREAEAKAKAEHSKLRHEQNHSRN
jgi:superfamily II DNA or RNA helicase